jgi:cobalt-zinc-cadmium efflux system outer membrane protein
MRALAAATAILAYALPTGALAQPVTAVPHFTLQTAVDRALATNPTLLAARARRAIGMAGVAVAAERVNPEVRVELDRDTPRQSYSVAVPWETGQKRRLRVAVAEAGARATDAEIAALELDIRRDVQRAYIDLAMTSARLTLLEELRALLERARDAARQRFDAGSAPRLEVVQADLASAQAQNEETAARGVLGAARVRLNALLGLALDQPTDVTRPDVGAAIGVDAAVSRARAASSELVLIERRLDEQRTKIALATALRRPDVTPEGSLTHGFGSDSDFQFGWKAAMAVSLPLFTSHKAGVVLEQATLTQLTAERNAMLARITGEVSAITAAAAAQREQYQRYQKQILPLTLDVERMAEDSYRLGQTGISAYLQALQATRDARLRALQAETDLHLALADLERTVGAPLGP